MGCSDNALAPRRAFYSIHGYQSDAFYFRIRGRHVCIGKLGNAVPRWNRCCGRQQHLSLRSDELCYFIVPQSSRNSTGATIQDNFFGDGGVENYFPNPYFHPTLTPGAPSHTSSARTPCARKESFNPYSAVTSLQNQRQKDSFHRPRP